jgi:tRNA dimethylallyltransferase
MDDSLKPKVIVICGPTGSGKTSLALNLAEEFNGCIVGADSMQIYKFMDIGTAKPSLKERARAPHYMIDIINPDEPYDAARYGRESRQSANQIHDVGMIPFVVGGTGFYIRAFMHGLFETNPIDPSVREKLKEKASLHGGKWLYEKLILCDPEAAGRIHPNDTYRIIRALEIHESTGTSMSDYQKAHGFRDHAFDVLKIGLSLDREILYNRIERRVEQMISDGLLDEVKSLLSMGYGGHLKSMQAIGYKHMLDYISGSVGWDTAILTLKRDTRRYAKRQLTWFKKNSGIIWKPPEDYGEIRSIVENFLIANH